MGYVHCSDTTCKISFKVVEVNLVKVVKLVSKLLKLTHREERNPELPEASRSESRGT